MTELEHLHRALVALSDSVDTLTNAVPASDALKTSCRRGHFRPAEERALLDWYARFLTVRNGLWEVVDEASRPLDGRVEGLVDISDWRCFVIAYGAACRIVRIDRLLLDEVATHTVVQRKLNEGSDLHRIPRKQYTRVFESFTDPSKARLMEQSMRFAEQHRELLNGMTADEVVGASVVKLGDWEAALDPSRRHYLRRLGAFLSHSFRRRGASTRQRTIFAVLKASGSLVSELRDHWTPPRVEDALRVRLEGLLRPGDVLVTRHDNALTNLFLPGYWPHAALYVGSEAEREALGVEIDEARRSRWSGPCRTLEALKDGVRFRPLEETTAVDAVAVIRPKLDGPELARGLARAAEHEGKIYNFDFDFFRSDRLVCTEVIYRAYDGLGPIRIPLQERSGRPTFSAEDLLDLALEGRGFEPIAVCGATSCPGRVVVGSEVAEALAASYRR